MFKSDNSTVASAMGVMVIAMLIAPFMDAIAKGLAVHHFLSPAFVTFARFAIQTLVLGLVVVVAWRMSKLKVYFSTINIIRGMLMGLTAMVFFTAIKYMPLADAISVFFVEPFIVMLMSAVILNEPVGWRRIIAAIIGFGGALLIIQPSYEIFGPIALLPLCAAFLFSCYLILTRISGSKDNPILMQFYAGIGGVLCCAVALMIGETATIENMAFTLPTSQLAWLLILAIGLLAVVSHLLIVIAFSRASASILAPFQYLEIVMATILGYVFFNDFPDALKWVGVFIIVGSGIYIFLRERKLERES